MEKLLRLVLLVLLLCGFVAGQTYPLPIYTKPPNRIAIVDVPNFNKTQVRGINSYGELVGIYRDNDGLQHGFLESYGTYTMLDYPDALQTLPRNINDRGVVVGMYADAILPMVELVVIAATIARHTIQLHNIAFTKTVIRPA